MSDSLPSVSGGSRFLPVGMTLGLIALVLVGMRMWSPRSTAPSSPSVEHSRAELELRLGRLYLQGQSNLFTGYLVERYPGGELQSRSAISNGVMHGMSEGWYTNGVLALREFFAEGKSHGVRTKWDNFSHKLSETPILQGTIHGVHREWHTNGQLALEVAMVDGKPNGVSRKWNLDASLAGQWVLSNGQVLEKPGISHPTMDKSKGGPP